MTSLSRELVFLILQFLEEERYWESVHRLEQESGFYFNMKYFEDVVVAGKWEEVERYLSGFTKVDDNRYSMKIFFEIRKQKYLEALDGNDRHKALEILMNELKVFSRFNEELFKEITHLLTMDNFRENEQLQKYGDSKSARALMLSELKKLIEANPSFRDKLQFPTLKISRLRTLINQSLNWQHQLCKNPRPSPDIKTLFYDHSCSQAANGAHVPSPAPPLMNIVPKPVFPQMGAHGPFPPTAGVAPLPTSLTGWMANPSSMPHAAVSGGPMVMGTPSNQASVLKRPRTPQASNPTVDYHFADSENVFKRMRPVGLPDEAGMPSAHMSAGYAVLTPRFQLHDELPKTVALTLNQGSSVISMDFHPNQQTLLLVGTQVGDILVWELISRERLAYRKFSVWDLQARSVQLQAALVKEPSVSVTRVTWSYDGNWIGVAYSKHIVHLYSFNGRDELGQHLEIDAHVGRVNDIAFSIPNKNLCIVTCGDDMTIKVWEAKSGATLYTFHGHEAAVYCVCPHTKENIQFIFSTSIDGKIKAWLYDNSGPKVDYDAPGNWCTTMAYSADGTRLFSCGTSQKGDTFIVEWHESEGSIKRKFDGFQKPSVGVVQFDTTRNRYLAAGDEFMVKFWDMDNGSLLAVTDADGGLPASPRLRFNKRGSLLAVSTDNNCIKILANAEVLQLLVTYNASGSASEAMVKANAISQLATVSALPGTSAPVADRGLSVGASLGMNADDQCTGDVKPIIIDESMEKSKIWKLTEISESSQCRSLKLPDNLLAAKLMCLHAQKPVIPIIVEGELVVLVADGSAVSCLLYTNSGIALLALTSNAVHKLWRWQKSDRNESGKSTTGAAPQLCQQSSGILMTNEISDRNPEEAVHCFALSKNDSYVMSTSGGKISLFNMMTFKTMTTFMSPPPAATFLAFHPQDNNVIAIGMDDFSIQIYNVQSDEVKSKLKGHQKRITGLAFSKVLNVLISSGADAQLCVWRTDSWDRQVSKFLEVPTGGFSGSLADTRVQFHHEQIQFLVVHATQLAIYEAPELKCLKQWIPRDGKITNATYACDSQMIYASYADGRIGIFTAARLQLRCRINPGAYLHLQPGSQGYPVVVAAHPSEPNQFALGLSDGSVHVIEPLESEGRWGTTPPPESGPDASSSQAAGIASLDRLSR